MPEVKEILKLLESQDTDDIREGAFLAGEERLDETVPLLVKHIQSQNIGVQEASDRALRRIGGEATVHAMSPLLRSDDAPVRNIAMDVLREVGSHDYSVVVDLLRDEDPDIRIFASDILGSVDNVLVVAPLCEALLRDPEVNVRYQAAVSLGSLARPEAAKCLNQAMNDEEWVQFSVIEALTKIRDESSVDALAKALDTSTDLVASMIVDALGEMGNVKAVPILMRRIDSSSTAMRNKIVKAIVNILGGKSLTLLSPDQREKFREYLLIALQDEEEDIQDAAIHGLAFVGGEQAVRSIVGLASGLNPDTDSERLEMAVESLAAIGFNPAVEEIIRTGEQFPAMILLESVSRMKKPEEAVPVLMDVFWEKDQDMAREIIKALLVAEGPEAGAFFLDVLEKHNDGSVIKTALYYLAHNPGTEGAVEKFFALLEHPYDDVKEAALEACIAIGGDGVAERFHAMITSPEPIQRMMAVYATGKLGSCSPEDLRGALEDEIPDIRKVAIEAIAEQDCEPEVTLELIATRLNDEVREVRLSVVEQLGTLPAAGASECLLHALDDEDDWVRIRAVEALGERAEQSVAPRLIEMMDDGNTLVRLKVVESLGRIGGQAAFRCLLDAVNSDDHELQAAAEEALARLQEQEGA